MRSKSRTIDKVINKKITLSIIGIILLSFLAFIILEKSSPSPKNLKSKVDTPLPKPVKASPNCSNSPNVSVGITGDRYEAKEKTISINHGQSILFVIKADAAHTLFLTNEIKKTKSLLGVNGYCSIYPLPGTYYFTVDQAITTTVTVK